MDSDFLILDLKGRLAHIEANLLRQDPLLPVHLGAIHTTLIQHEELVHLLSDEDIRNLVAGQKKHSGVQLVKEATTKKTAPKAVPRGSSIANEL